MGGGPADRVHRAIEVLERLWDDLGVSPGDALAPGLDDSEIDALADEFDVAVNGELRAWWGWRDGVVGYDRWTDLRGTWNIVSDAVMPSLRGALEQRASETRTWLDEERPLWTPAWLLVVRKEGLDLAARVQPARSTSAILALDPVGDFTVPFADSLAELLEWWALALRSGWLRPADEPGRWEVWGPPADEGPERLL